MRVPPEHKVVLLLDSESDKVMLFGNKNCVVGTEPGHFIMHRKLKVKSFHLGRCLQIM